MLAGRLAVGGVGPRGGDGGVQADGLAGRLRGAVAGVGEGGRMNGRKKVDARW